MIPRATAIAIAAAAMPAAVPATSPPRTVPTQPRSDISGMYRLVLDERRIVATGEVTRNPHPQGYVSYDRDGRMIVLIVRDPRPRPASSSAISERQKSELFGTMTAYAGTYRFDGATVTHHIDLSWNGAWIGTSQIRSVRQEGDRLIYTTRPFPYLTDGRMSVATLIWKRV